LTPNIISASITSRSGRAYRQERLLVFGLTRA